jgi:ankyrin repeat protein
MTIVQSGANPNCETHYDRLTPLMVAASLGSYKSTEALLQHGANKEACDRSNNRPLMFAAVRRGPAVPPCCHPRARVLSSFHPLIISSSSPLMLACCVF